ncbi:Uncharacterized protein DAT39_012100, partial [Clarias magur]
MRQVGVGGGGVRSRGRHLGEKVCFELSGHNDLRVLVVAQRTEVETTRRSGPRSVCGICSEAEWVCSYAQHGY